MPVLGNLSYKKKRGGGSQGKICLRGGGGMRLMKLECVNFTYCLSIDISHKQLVNQSSGKSWTDHDLHPKFIPLSMLNNVNCLAIKNGAFGISHDNL